MRIIGRAEWGAVKEAARPAMRLPATALWLHHSVTNPTGDPFADMRTIQQIGIGRFGYLSYSFAVHPAGTILEGQGTMVGAHTAGQNSSSFGVVLIGNYEERQPTDAQVEGVRWLMAHLLERKALKAGVYPTGGHRDAPGAATVCPGRWAMDRLRTMRVPWIPPPAPTGPAPSGPSYDYEEATVKTMLVHVGPLDSNGNGWADWQPGLGRDPVIVAVTLLGPSPVDDGYWPQQAKVNLSAQPRGGSARVVVRGGTPGDTVSCWVTVS